MNDAACIVFVNIINLSVRMMPLYVCLPSKHNKENIAAISVYLWVVMVTLLSIFSFRSLYAAIFQGVFAGLFFFVLLIFFEGSVIKKAFLYISAWLFTSLSTSISVLASWLFSGSLGLSLAQVNLIVTVLYAVAVFAFVKYYLAKTVDPLFQSLPVRNATLLLAVPAFFLFLLYLTSGTIFSAQTLFQRGLSDILLFFVFCVMIIALYIILINNMLGILKMDRTQTELAFARQLIEQQKEHYHQILNYQEQIRIIKHDFRHHIHALRYMSKEEEKEYLNRLGSELTADAELIFCKVASVDSILREYADRAKQEAVRFTAKVDLPEHIPIDDLTLCIIIGNLLENAFEACEKLEAGRFVTLNARWEEDSLRMMVENAFNGQVKKSGGRFLSTKSAGGLGLMSIRRLLTKPEDDFDTYYTDETFVAMVKITDRTIK